MIKKHSQENGFTSINSYVLSLIDNDLKSDNDWAVEVTDGIQWQNNIIVRFCITDTMWCFIVPSGAVRFYTINLIML